MSYSKAQNKSSRRSSTLSRLCALALLAFASGSFSLASAQANTEAPNASADAEARAHFESGRLAYESGRFEEALADFKRAYELSSQPALLFNIGASADRLRRDEEALRAYRAYLEARPDAFNADEVRGRIASIDAALEQRRASQAALEEERNLEAERRRIEAARLETAERAARRRTPEFMLIGVGGAVAATGGILLGLGVRDVNTVEDAPAGTPWNDVRNEEERAPRRIGVGIAAMTVGLLSAGAGVTWMLLRGPPSEDSSAHALRVTMTAGGLVLDGRF